MLLGEKPFKVSVRTLRKEIEAHIAPLGFTYQGKEGSKRWLFSRTQDEVVQTITIEQDRYETKLSLTFKTSMIRMPTSWRYFFPVERWIPLGRFQDEESLVQILQIMREKIFERGLRILEMMSIPDLKPSEDAERLVLEEHGEKAVEFAKTYSLSFESDPIKEVEKLEAILLENRATVENVDWEFLIGAGAFYGKLVADTFHGEWEWHESGKCLVTNIRYPHSTDSVAPLKQVSIFWQKPDMVLSSPAWHFAHLAEKISGEWDRKVMKLLNEDVEERGGSRK